MHARRGGQAMATHGRHILLENVAQIAAQRRAKRSKGLAVLLVTGAAWFLTAGCATSTQVKVECVGRDGWASRTCPKVDCRT
jgi:hypothetical protein